jgi:hypothetical protein
VTHLVVGAEPTNLVQPLYRSKFLEPERPDRFHALAFCTSADPQSMI